MYVRAYLCMYVCICIYIYIIMYKLGRCNYILSFLASALHECREWVLVLIQRAMNLLVFSSCRIWQTSSSSIFSPITHPLIYPMHTYMHTYIHTYIHTFPRPSTSPNTCDPSAQTLVFCWLEKAVWCNWPWSSSATSTDFLCLRWVSECVSERVSEWGSQWVSEWDA